MSQQAEVVIVGSGITGCAIAWFLARAGMNDIIVVDKSGIAAGATGICPGGVRQQWGTAINCQLSKRAAGFYREMDDYLKPEYPVAFRPVGYLFLGHSDKAMKGLAQNVSLQNQYGIDSRMITPDEVGKLVRGVNTDLIQGASWCPSDGFVDDAYSVTQNFATAAKQLGVRFLQAEVHKILLDGAKVAGVDTSHGTIAANYVINAAGVDSRALAASVGVSIPIQPELRRLMFTNRIVERVLEPLMISLEMGFAAKQLQDGTIYLSYLGSDVQPPYDAFRYQTRVAEVGGALYPPLLDMELRRSLDGTYDTTPDHQPILGGIDGLDGYFQAVGMSGHGFMLAPAIAECVSALVLGEQPPIDISPLHFNRFAAGRLLPEPNVV